ncbi:MAG TPA: hypothetical protein IAC02_01045 [Candidatus Coprovivens excrementavium]|nr:hypothetical protein [Candidatus Coprovivens excrementavium]
MKKLYLSFVDEKEHGKIAKQIIGLEEYNWITTYDVQDEILKLYMPFVQTYKYELKYSANTKRRAIEYLFASNCTKLESYGKVVLNKV